MARPNLTRRQLLQSSAFLGCAATLPFSWRLQQENQTAPSHPGSATAPLTPPANGKIPVAFVISDGAVVIDFCGPWEVFQDAAPSDGKGGFHLYTVAERHAPVETSGGMKILPNYTFENAPQPKIIVIPAQNGDNETMYRWIRESSRAADVTMSVCTGAFVLAETGLLSGKAATTHHGSYSNLAMQFPDIQVKRGARFVEDGNLASSGGLSCGIDLALRVVERYYGREQAQQTADMMEYQGQGWLNPNSNQAYAKVRASTDERPVCIVCSMDADPALKSVYKGKNYYFCSSGHKAMFDKSPASFADAR
jgi:transcriptional regulator GlxA family with amidase domain/YHS domain-containing protein